MNVDAVGQRVEELLDQIAERDEVAVELTEELLRELLALYGTGLARVLERLTAAAPDASRELASDPLVGGLLLLHGLHPDDVSARVDAALARVRAELASDGGDVALLDVRDGVARLRLAGVGDGCGSTQAAMRAAVEGAVLEAAPEIERVELDVSAARSPALIPAESLSMRRRPPDWAGATR